MPQAPLPPLGARLQATNLISPIVKGTPTPMDVIQHQQLIDFAQRFGEGVDIGKKLMRLPRDAAENAAQKAHAVLDKAYTQEIQKAASAIIADPKYKNDPRGLSLALEKLLVPSGIYQSGEEGGFSPETPISLYGKNYFTPVEPVEPEKPKPAPLQPKGKVTTGDLIGPNGERIKTDQGDGNGGGDNKDSEPSNPIEQQFKNHTGSHAALDLSNSSGLAYQPLNYYPPAQFGNNGQSNTVLPAAPIDTDTESAYV